MPSGRSLPVPGEARADWQILCDVAKRMGWAEAFSYTSPAEIFREYAGLSGRAAALGRDFDISGLANLSDQEYDDFAPVQWPVQWSVRDDKSGDGRFFADGKFYHGDGKAQMVPVTAMALSEFANDVFHLNTGRVRDQWHTMTRSGKSPRLGQHVVEPFAEIHPRDAKQLAINDAGLVEIEALKSNSAGRAVVRVKVSADVPAGSVFVPMHWSDVNSSAGRVNGLVEDVCDPVSGQPALKGSQVRLKPFKALWYGFAVSVSPMRSIRSYSAIARNNTGWSCELAGLDDVSDWEAEARAVLNLPTGDASILCDEARGIARVAIYDGPVLTGLFFAAPQPLVIARAHLISQIGQTIPALTALAGLPIGDQPDSGRTVCACFNVGINTIRTAIIEGATNMAALGKCTAAGTNCGSCKAELQVLIDNHKALKAAE